MHSDGGRPAAPSPFPLDRLRLQLVLRPGRHRRDATGCLWLLLRRDRRRLHPLPLAATRHRPTGRAWCAIIAVVGGTTLVGVALLGTAHSSIALAAAIVLPMMVYMIDTGLVMANPVAAAIGPFPEQPARLCVSRLQPDDDRGAGWYCRCSAKQWQGRSDDRCHRLRSDRHPAGVQAAGASTGATRRLEPPMNAATYGCRVG